MEVRLYGMYKGDTYLYSGTKKELADYLGVKKRTIDFYLSNVYAKRCSNSDNRIEVFELGGEEDEEETKTLGS